ncbi:MAG: cysteine--tRNA ligase, partial [Pseudomonadota bacterium]
MDLTLYNTRTREKALFVPDDPTRVRMYVCGPTVYDYAHIGNARPIVVFDAVFRLLRYVYGPEHVIYARNITDVDDKINARAAEEGVAISDVTERTIAQFHEDIAALGVLEPTIEPRATEHIEDMRTLIETLVARDHAYVAEDHVLFHVPSMPNYGRLSRRSTDELEAGARVEVAPYKRDPMDFVLWKPSKSGDPSWPSPCGIATPGRPGWHIECSAMAEKHLGATFDIHGGGIDLVFPHHENEIAQSCCAYGTEVLANVWMHNGFLQVEGEKMSKSLGNFITIHDLLATDGFGEQKWPGRVLRWAMLATHYRQPLDWTVDRLTQARNTLADFADLIADVPPADAPNDDVIAALRDDLNTPSAMSIVHGIAKSARRGNAARAADLSATLRFLGLYGGETREDFMAGRAVPEVDETQVEALVAERLEARKAKNWAESDRLRDELAALGVQVKDSKDPQSG